MVDDRKPEDILKEVIDQQQRMLDAQQRDHAKRDAQLFSMLKASIANGAGGEQLAEAAQKHIEQIEQIEKSLGGLVVRRPDFEADQWDKLDAVLAPMAAADLKRDTRIDPWAYVPATDPRAVEAVKRLLKERRDLEEKVKQQQQQQQQPPAGAAPAAAN